MREPCPNNEAVVHLVGALMLEQSDEWTDGRRYFSLESLAKLADTDTCKLPAVAA
jgi:putative transposase